MSPPVKRGTSFIRLRGGNTAGTGQVLLRDAWRRSDGSEGTEQLLNRGCEVEGTRGNGRIGRVYKLLIKTHTDVYC